MTTTQEAIHEARANAFRSALCRLYSWHETPLPVADEIIKVLNSDEEMLNALATKSAGENPFEQVTDVYGVACDVHLVRTFRDGRQLGAGYALTEPSTWFVYDSEDEKAKWHQHCGPYSTFEQAVDWINDVREVR